LFIYPPFIYPSFIYSSFIYDLFIVYLSSENTSVKGSHNLLSGKEAQAITAAVSVARNIHSKATQGGGRGYWEGDHSCSKYGSINALKKYCGGGGYLEEGGGYSCSIAVCMVRHILCRVE